LISYCGNIYFRYLVFMAISGKDLIGTIEAAKALGVTSRQVVNMIRAGVLPGKPFAGAYMIRRADLAKVPKDRKPGPKKTRG
jgi:hypothetical protein